MNPTHTLEAVAEDGRRVHCWVNRAETPDKAAPVVVLLSAFGRRMHQYAGLCQHLTVNGLDTLRFDALNHVGLSDGDSLEYTLSDGLLSLDAAVKATRRTFGPRRIILVATSLAARIAVRHMASDPSLDGLIALAGVVNVQSTLARVLEHDYAADTESELPAHVTFEHQDIGASRFYLDMHRHDWISLARTREEIANLTQRVHWFVGEDDAWVDIDEVRDCVAANRMERADMTVLRACGHDIGRNAAMSRVLTRQVVKLCRGPADLRPVVEPAHGTILEISLQERRIQRTRHVNSGASLWTGASI